MEARPGHGAILRLRHHPHRHRARPGRRVLRQGPRIRPDQAFAAGDAEEIAEASAAIFSGKIRGLEVARALGHDVGEIAQGVVRRRPRSSSRSPGRPRPRNYPAEETGVFPVLHCVQEIPCDPCTTVCPQRPHPHPRRATSAACPSSASPRPARAAPAARSASPSARAWPSRSSITARIPNSRPSPSPTSSSRTASSPATRSRSSTPTGPALGEVEVVGVRAIKANDRTVLVKVRVPKAVAKRIAGLARPGRRRRPSRWTATSSGRPTTRSSAAASASRPGRSGP